jgi:hypothetical protein
VQWLKSVILVTWEVEIRRIAVPGQASPDKKFARLHLNETGGHGHPSYSGSVNRRVMDQVHSGTQPGPISKTRPRSVKA